ncbi:MAG: hypothetical protein NVS2B16_01960 [Chloroflexota bacterium]
MLEIRTTAENQDWNLIALRSQGPNDIEPIHVRQGQIKDHSVTGAATQNFQGRIARPYGVSHMSRGRQSLAQQTLHQCIIVHYQYMHVSVSGQSGPAFPPHL